MAVGAAWSNRYAPIVWEENNLNTSAVSLAGTPAASPLGYFSWTFGQAARDPYYI